MKHASTSTFSGNFAALIQSGNPIGEVISVDKYTMRIKGLHPVNVGAPVLLEDGSRGLVRFVHDAYVMVLGLGDKPPVVGTIAVVESDKFTVPVGEQFIGRVISVSGEPLDGRGPIRSDKHWQVFTAAPKIYERQQLSDLLHTGVSLIDGVFPIVKGQRMAILGDSKSGKSTVATQIAINQKNTDIITIYVMIAKRDTDVEALLSKLQENDALKSTIVIISTVFESPAMSYIAPYVGCSLAEYLWQEKDRDVIIVYDDLTSHAQAHREIGLVSGSNPGRDSYMGDTFYIHSSLLERAGRLQRNHKTLTALPIVLALGGDITAYLPTNVISITDGQWIMDIEMFRDGLRPPISTGLSVTRVGGVGHNTRQKDLASRTLKMLESYSQALEFSHFGSDSSADSQHALKVGGYLKQAFSQLPGESYSITAQQLMLNIILDTPQGQSLNVPDLKQLVNSVDSSITDDKSYDNVLKNLQKKVYRKDA